MQYSTPTTTSESTSEGRMKVDAGCCHNKKKCLKCSIKKYSGKGGPGNIDPMGFGVSKTSVSVSFNKKPLLKKSKSIKKIIGTGFRAGKSLISLSKLMKPPKISNLFKPGGSTKILKVKGIIKKAF